MNHSPSHDPFIALWHTAPRPDTDDLLRGVRRLRQMHQRLAWTIAAILLTVTLLLVLAEVAGRIATHGLLSAIWILALLIGTIRGRRARCRRADALALDTVGLLKFLLARARNDLFLARCLYAGVPCGAIAGALAAEFIRSHASRHVAFTLLPSALTVAGAIVLIAMVVAGLVMARARRIDITELSKTLQMFEDSL